VLAGAVNPSRLRRRRFRKAPPAQATVTSGLRDVICTPNPFSLQFPRATPETHIIRPTGVSERGTGAACPTKIKKFRFFPCPWILSVAAVAMRPLIASIPGGLQRIDECPIRACTQAVSIGPEVCPDDNVPGDGFRINPRLRRDRYGSPKQETPEFYRRFISSRWGA
jgi:hypothetical protein